jgi:tRNA-dependent cyclodipeptide synthase
LSDRSAVIKVKETLDSKVIPYTHLAYSTAYSPEKILKDKNDLGKEHIESVLIEIINADNIAQIAMIIVPATRKIDLHSLQKILNNKRIKFVGKGTQTLYPNYEMGTLPPFADFYPNMYIYLTEEILQLQEVAIHIQSYADCIRMSLKNFLAAAHPVENITLATTAKYRIEIDQVFPEIKLDALENYSHCMLGFSLQSRSFIPGKLAGMTEWISAHFSECTVIIADSIHRHTLEIDGVPTKYALNQALRLGREAIDHNAMIFNRHQEQCKFNFVLCSDLQKEDDYHVYYKNLVKLFEEDENFKRSVKSFADMFVKDRPHQKPELIDYHIQLSSHYFLEEAACVALLVKKGVFILLYPGAITAFQELCQGQFSTAPKEFEDMINVSLHLKRR